jgi:hypothetical protein
VGGSRPLFETFTWRVRRADLQDSAMKRLGVTDATDPRIEAEMRRMLPTQLLKAFRRPQMNALSADERAAYLSVF